MAPEGISDVDQVKRDEERLAELGYKQELPRAWSSFTNFAISFTISRCSPGASRRSRSRGGTVARSRSRSAGPCSLSSSCWSAFSMSELTSAYPTAGGPYWWAHDLGGPGWSWMTGWFNIAGLIGIVASVGYGAAIFLGTVLGLYKSTSSVSTSPTPTTFCARPGFSSLLILVLYTIVNISGTSSSPG